MAIVGLTSINVVGCGAKGDGVTDDTNAIQMAFDAVPASGGTVYFPPGVYLCTTVTPKSKTHVVGAGPGRTTLLGPAGALAGATYNGNTLAATIGGIGVDHVTIEGLTIDHVTNGTQANGIAFIPADAFAGTPCSFIVIRNCELFAYSNHSYQIWSMRGQHVQILDNVVDGGTTGPRDPDCNGIEAYGGLDVIIRGNQVRRMSGRGVYCGSADGYDNTGVTDAVIAGNVLESCNQGIHLSTALGVGLVAPQNLLNVQVTDNVITGSVVNAIKLNLPHGGTSATNVRIAGNVCNGGDVPILVSGQAGDTGHHGTVIEGNTALNAGTTINGAIAATNFLNLRVGHNRVYNSAGAGLLFQGCSNLLVESNDVETCALQGVSIDSCAKLNVLRNLVRFHGVGVPGIVVSNSSVGVVNENRLDHTVTNANEISIASSCTAFEMRRNQVLFTSTLSTGPGGHFTNSSVGAKNSGVTAKFQHWVSLVAPGPTGVHAAVAANAANAFPGPITQMAVPRAVRCAFATGWDGGNIQVTGLDQFGVTKTDTIVANPGASVDGVIAFASITSIAKTAIGVTTNTVTVGPGGPIGLAEHPATTLVQNYKYTAGVPAIVNTTVNSTNATWFSGTPPAGDNWAIIYEVYENG